MAFYILVTVILLACSHLSLALGPADYPLVDSRIAAFGSRPSVWLDDERVVFFGRDERKLIKGKPFPGYKKPTPYTVTNWLYNDDQFIWNVRTGEIERPSRPMFGLCVFGGEVGYMSQEPSDDPTVYWYSGVYGKETRQPRPEQYWLNPHSCRFYTKPPPWEKAREKGRVPRPLLEEHGYIDVGPNALPREGFPRLFKPERPDTPIELKPLWNGRWHFRYVPHVDAYIVDNIDHFPTAFLMSPQGELRKAPFPKASPRKYGAVLYTKEGFFYRNLEGRNNVEDTETIGGYLLTDSRLSRIVVGMLEAISVSPDGCRIAFSHAPSAKAHYDGLESYRRGGLSNTTMKMINVCKAGRKQV